MTAYPSVFDTPPVVRTNEHGGRGAIYFRRMLARDDFTAPIDFVDFTVVPPGSEIGWHRHDGNDELYYVVDGHPLMRMDGHVARLKPGSLTVVRDGGSHALVNDTDADVSILVVQVRL